jgi:NitT/TauT family transport system substrate-binding protein
MTLPRLFLLAAFAAGLAATTPAQAQQTLEKTDIQLSVGGKPLVYYLPLTITDQLGYFKDAGLNVQIQDFPGGAKSLQALVGGSVDVTTGSYEHTIQMQAKNQPLMAVAQLGRFPGIGFGVLKSKADAYKGPQDLKGMKIGVTAPGSSTNFMVKFLMARNGLSPDDAAYIGVGGGASAVAAARRGEIDAISNTDPVISQLESQDLIKVIYDTRTAEGAQQVYGGAYPAAVLYLPPAFAEANPNTTQALVNAFVRGLKWIQKATPEDIVAKMPDEYKLGDPDAYLKAVRSSMEMFAHDGRIPQEGPQNVLNVLSQFDDTTKGAKIDLAKTYTNQYVEKALAKYKD